MEQTVQVRRTFENGTAEVVRIRESACSGDCHKCSGCGAQQETMLITVHNPIAAKTGDLVVIESATGPVLKAAAMLYILPVVLFLAGYLLGEHLIQMGPLFGLIGIVVGLVLVKVYDRHLQKKKDPIYTITGYAR